MMGATYDGYQQKNSHNTLEVMWEFVMIVFVRLFSIAGKDAQEIKEKVDEVQVECQTA